MIFPNLLLTHSVNLTGSLNLDNVEKKNTESIYNNKLYSMILYESSYIRFEIVCRPIHIKSSRMASNYRLGWNYAFYDHPRLPG